ncbi:hypothetical protein A3A84_01030 [Candidatus Collierbacteria bacterium RIFCSPLOWO2_01_FULL_50_23]|uniref:Uncharacterized protein n=2 Tax=Candidatus Collieribacteriota TaxID=1752725 RepID=A0A1F5EQP8_9BACT|nr:MAG: hypothetical protein A3D09_01780 [Candidatus Collierbacteria bacterium RIFCSPHIGHO2_02_FULL_49_10]OGD71369.1 MAG: hypothetical protein A2703_03575 [Candidatus Collierbacteria bacterium RIFCSPHIGHO2_01_FULL_50_25]OGD74036.1 MAG: hypothetical protein A3A84_01030 [Candidatus Collierbacteria bacterium RIFCSPLOWO2_01_FULL_50_23]
MIQRLAAPVSVDFISDHKTRRVLPRSLCWDGRVHPITKIGLHHTYRQGRTLFHVFSVLAQTIYFRLRLDTDTLFWQLEEISDGLPD